MRRGHDGASAPPASLRHWPFWAIIGAMPAVHPLHITSRAVLAAALIGHCAAHAGAPAAQALNEVKAHIGQAACTIDAHCRTVAIGSRACGGPDAYLAWSTLKTDADALQRAVDRYNGARPEGRSPGRHPSICAVVTDPGAACLPTAASAALGLKSCQLRPRGAAPDLPSR